MTAKMFVDLRKQDCGVTRKIIGYNNMNSPKVIFNV